MTRYTGKSFQRTSTDHGLDPLKQIEQVGRACRLQKVKEVVAERVAVLLKEALRTVVDIARKVADAKGVHDRGLGLEVAWVARVLPVELLQHGKVSTLVGVGKRREEEEGRGGKRRREEEGRGGGKRRRRLGIMPQHHSSSPSLGYSARCFSQLKWGKTPPHVFN